MLVVVVEGWACAVVSSVLFKSLLVNPKLEFGKSTLKGLIGSSSCSNISESFLVGSSVLFSIVPCVGAAAASLEAALNTCEIQGRCRAVCSIVIR